MNYIRAIKLPVVNITDLLIYPDSDVNDLNDMSDGGGGGGWGRAIIVWGFFTKYIMHAQL